MVQRRQLIRSVAGLGTAGVIGLPTLLRAQSGPIVLGQSAAFSGPAAQLGEQFRRGALLHFDAVNAKGGIGGRRIELLSQDDGYEPDRCAANTQTLIAKGVTALFGYVGTPTSMAALPLATAAKLPFVAPFTGAEGLRTPFNRYAFHVRASYFDETAEIVKQLTSVGIKRIAVFHQNDSYGKAGLEGVQRALKPLGLEPVALGTVERNTVEVGQAVKAIVAARPDAIVQISAYKSCAAFIRAARAAGFAGSFYNVSFVGTQALADELGPEAAGVVVSQVMPYPFSAATPVVSEYLAAGSASGKPFAPSYGSIEGYVAAKVMAEGLRRAGPSLSTDAQITALESLRDFNVGGFFVDFGPRRREGSHFVDLTILTRNGRVRR